MIIWGLENIDALKRILGITYDTPAHVIEIFVKKLKEIVEKHPQTEKKKYHIYLNNFGSSSIDILFYVFLEVSTWGEELRVRQEIMLSIIRLANEMNVRFAFPTQTLFVEEVPGADSLTPSYPSKEDLENKFK